MMTLGDTRVSGATHRIYETVLNSSLWPAALDEVSSLFGEAKSTIIVQDISNAEQTFVKSSTNFNLEKLQVYSEKFSEIELTAWNAVRRNGLGRVTTESDFFDGDYEAHPSTAFLEEHLGIFHRNAVLYRQLPDWAETVSIATSRRQGPLNPHERKLLCDMSTHLALASRIARPFNRLREKYGAVIALLDRLAIGVMLLDQRGRVVHTNASMQDVLEAVSEFSVTRTGHLAFRDPTTEAAFKALRLAASRTLDLNGVPPDFGSIWLRGNGAFTMALEVVPLIDNSGDIEGQFIGFALLAMAPSLAPSLPVGQLGRLFELTKAESQVCDHLVAGLSTQEIADHRSTSHETARSQIKSVLQKTGSKGRSSLIRLAFDYAIPLRDGTE
jgi:DNA-binding CsgD family transcriptional regulator